MNNNVKIKRPSYQDSMIIKKDENAGKQLENNPSSPLFMRFTQDTCEDDSEVVWEWDSPKTRTNQHIFRKRICHSSPKIPKKIIREDKPRLSTLKSKLELIANIEPKPAEDAFNDDSFDEELFQCTQKAEESYNLDKWCSKIMNNKNTKTDIEDDSFDMFLEEIKDEDIDRFTQDTLVKKTSSPRSICRTNSVPYFSKSSTSSSLINRTKSDGIQEEIERKRQEAIAKLELKRKQSEIEKKRLEALEKLAKKRIQKITKNCIINKT